MAEKIIFDCFKHGQSRDLAVWGETKCPYCQIEELERQVDKQPDTTRFEQFEKWAETYDYRAVDAVRRFKMYQADVARRQREQMLASS